MTADDYNPGTNLSEFTDAQDDAQTQQCAQEKEQYYTPVGETRVPPALIDHDIWLLWAPEHGKVPFAPWNTGDCFPAGWGKGVVENENSRMTARPETSFAQAHSFASKPPEQLNDEYGFPPADGGGPPLVPDEVYPTIFLPHDPPEPPILLVDLDDVRDPETGEISAEVQGILERLGGYVEVSSSGSGLHCFVRGELPGGRGKFIEPLDGEGHVEMYDHGRFVGCTWDHVPWTPVDVPEAQDVINDIAESYDTVTCDGCDEWHRTAELPERGDDDVDCPDCGETLYYGAHDAQGGARDDANLSVSARIREVRGEDTNPYFDLDVRDVADTGKFSKHRRDAPGHNWQGPHPTHGAQSGAQWDSDSSNFSVDTTDNVWCCFAHDTGGGPIALLAVVEGVVRCRNAKRVYEDNVDLLKTCLYARESAGGDLDDEAPPRDALRGVADVMDLGPWSDDTERIALRIYDEMEPSDV